MVRTRTGGIEATPMAQTVDSYLAMLEEKLDPDHLASVEQRQIKSLCYEKIDHIPVMVTLRDDVSHQTFGNTDWPTFFWEQQLGNYDYMLLNELLPAYESALLKDDKCFSIRPNLGQCFIPSLFGCLPEINEAELDSLPWIKRDPKLHTKEGVQKLIDAGVPETKGKLIDQYEEIVAHWTNRLAPFPKLRQFTHITLPDVQGPFNLAFHLRGVDLYTDILDDPDFVHALLKLVTETFEVTARHCKGIIGEPLDEAYYWNWHIKGGVRNVDDNSVMIAPEEYAEFVKPYNSKAFQPFGGGAHHCCGELEHLYDELFSIKGNNAMHFGNPEMQDFGNAYPLLADRKIGILWDDSLPEQFRCEVKTGIVVREICTSMEQARSCLDNYQKYW